MVGERIKTRREKMGFKTQEALADAIGVDRTRVSRWESGRNLPTGELRTTLLRILKSKESGIFSIEGAAVPINRPQFENLSMALAARILNYYQDAEPRRQLAALYILSKDESFRDALANLPEGARFARVISKLV